MFLIVNLHNLSAFLIFSFNPNFNKYETKRNKISNTKLNLHLGWVSTELEVRLYNHSHVDRMDGTMSNFFPSLNHLRLFSITLRLAS